MTALTLPRVQIERAIAACLTGLADNTRRAYSARIAHYLAGGHSLTRGDLSAWGDELAKAGQSPAAVNQALSAVKRLAQEAASLGWLPWETAIQIRSVRSRKCRGVRTGKWLTVAQVKRLLALPDRTTPPGKRDAAVLALLIGAGLRRSEACGLTTAQIRYQITETGPVTLIVNLAGKGGRVRTIQLPEWAARDIREWMESAQITDGKVLRSLKA